MYALVRTSRLSHHNTVHAWGRLASIVYALLQIVLLQMFNIPTAAQVRFFPLSKRCGPEITSAHPQAVFFQIAFCVALHSHLQRSSLPYLFAFWYIDLRCFKKFSFQAVNASSFQSPFGVPGESYNWIYRLELEDLAVLINTSTSKSSKPMITLFAHQHINPSFSLQ